MSSVHHKIILKRKATDDDSPLCYCELDRVDQFMFVCEQCRRNVHVGCLKSERPSQLLGDIYFKFVCEMCSPSAEESFERLNLPWAVVLLISLYNLQVQSSSKCGYFKWRSQICAFIEKHWVTFFGSLRKKSSNWPGTVAGILSSHSDTLFKSGTADLKEPGWWQLSSETSLPTVDELLQSNSRKTKTSKAKKKEQGVVVAENVGLRNRSSKSSIQAAIELKEKRSQLLEAKEIRQNLATTSTDRRMTKEKVLDTSLCEENLGLSSTVEESFWVSPITNTIKVEEEENAPNSTQECADFWVPQLNVDGYILPHVQNDENDVLCDIKPMEIVKEEPVDWQFDIIDEIEDEEDNFLDDRNVGLALEVKSENVPLLQTQSIEIGDLMAFNVPDISLANEIEVNTSFDNSDESSNASEVQENYSNNNAETRTVNGKKLDTINYDKSKFIFMTEYDEHQLLKKLESISDAVGTSYCAKRLRRKLLVRQRQRERNLPLFDLDEQFRKFSGVREQELTVPLLGNSLSTCTLDRFQLVCGSAQGRTHSSFVTRLMGFEDEHLESIISPYTMRILKPFIFRDYESCPLKLKLLNEIQHFPHRKDPTWKKPKQYPLDFCYVRPHHIPVINNLCHAFFWPGIDLSECLQYPDFSCVVLYRKVVVGFAFMVPDVKYNEVYISFIFTHPEWRNAGIAKFMIYHLIQTCMGKDVTLHVSVTNPAVFLYQRFGFKVEELILNFYDKYLPVKSKECRHALFLRLSR